MTAGTDVVATLGPVVELLERLGLRYLIGGSVASSVYGTPRATMDVDLMAEVGEDDVDRFVSGLGDEFYASAEMIRNAVEGRSSFNLIHRPTMMKVDVFIPEDRAFDRFQLERRRRKTLGDEPHLEAWVASPEDVVLKKLEWARSGDGVSEVQVRDVVGVLRVQGGSLDFDYLRRWAARLGVEDLLERALEEAEPE